jgi:hypothetical protein
LRKNSTRRRRRRRRRKIWAYDRLQVPDHSLGGYSHRERWLHTRWRFTSRRSSVKNKEENLSPWTWHFLPSGARIQEPDDFGHCIWSRRCMKSKIEEVKDWSLETQPESATQVESRGLLTWICPLGTRRLVYRVRPIKEVDRHKDSKMTWRQRRKVLIHIWLGHCKL